MKENPESEIDYPVPALEKLPLWGYQAPPDEINFEWPTPEILAQQGEDVSLKAITIKATKFGCISSIQV